MNLCILLSLSIIGANDDLSLSMTSIIIPAGSIPTGGLDCVNVTATDDTFLEGDEQFYITITGTNIAEVTVGASSTSTVNITDLDGTKATIAILCTYTLPCLSSPCLGVLITYIYASIL